MKRFTLMLILLSALALVACGGNEPEPIASVPEIVEPVATIQVVTEPTDVPATPVPPTAIPTVVAVVEPTDVPVVVVEPTVEIVEEPTDDREPFAYGVYREPDITTILATGRPQFINSYADW